MFYEDNYSITHKEAYQSWERRAGFGMATIGEWKSDPRGIQTIVWVEWMNEIVEEWYAFKVVRNGKWKIEELKE